MKLRRLVTSITLGALLAAAGPVVADARPPGRNGEARLEPRVSVLGADLLRLLTWLALGGTTPAAPVDPPDDPPVDRPAEGPQTDPNG